MINSLEISGITGKDHKHVKRDIKSIYGLSMVSILVITNKSTQKVVEVYELTEEQIQSLPYSKLIMLEKEVIYLKDVIVKNRLYHENDTKSLVAQIGHIAKENARLKEENDVLKREVYDLKIKFNDLKQFVRKEIAKEVLKRTKKLSKKGK